MSVFKRNNGTLHCEDISLNTLAEDFGTPLFVYDSDVIARRIRELRSILPARFEVFYASDRRPP